MPDTQPADDSTRVLSGFIQEHDHGVPTVRVWCRWCLEFHEFGLAGTTVGDTMQRTPHCSAPDSEYKNADYRIRVTSTSYEAVRTSVRRPTGAQREALRAGRITAAIQALRDQPGPA